MGMGLALSEHQAAYLACTAGRAGRLQYAALAVCMLCKLSCTVLGLHCAFSCNSADSVTL
jgi:hypothetical protein